MPNPSPSHPITLSPPQPLRLACLISGGGRTLMNIADQIDAGKLNARIDLVISSRGDVAGVEKSKARGFNTLIVRRKDFPTDIWKLPLDAVW